MVTRTDRSRELIGAYVPSFKSAQIRAKPLFGAQQIPGGDQNLRAADVSFANEKYARCEAVKASSFLTCADQIVKQMGYCHLIDPNIKATRSFPIT